MLRSLYPLPPLITMTHTHFHTGFRVCCFRVLGLALGIPRTFIVAALWLIHSLGGGGEGGGRRWGEGGGGRGKERRGWGREGLGIRVGGFGVWGGRERICGVWRDTCMGFRYYLRNSFQVLGSVSCVP